LGVLGYEVGTEGLSAVALCCPKLRRVSCSAIAFAVKRVVRQVRWAPGVVIEEKRYAEGTVWKALRDVGREEFVVW
jgi:hypothetical protein